MFVILRCNVISGCVLIKINMAASSGRSESKITLEIRTKSVEQTLVPLVTQVRLWYLLIAMLVSVLNCRFCVTSNSYRPSGRGQTPTFVRCNTSFHAGCV